MASILSWRRARAPRSRFEELLAPHLDHLYRLAWRFTGGTADAEDLIQELLLKLYPRRDDLAGVEALRPWLARVLYRQYVDGLRRRARSPALEAADDEALEHLPDPGDGPEEHAERARWRERIVSALARLNPEQRAVVALHDIEGYRLEELVAILEAPLGTLKSRLHRARERLRALLPMEPFSRRERVNG